MFGQVSSFTPEGRAASVTDVASEMRVPILMKIYWLDNRTGRIGWS
jgi:hypothetical protein